MTFTKNVSTYREHCLRQAVLPNILNNRLELQNTEGFPDLINIITDFFISAKNVTCLIFNILAH